MGRWSIAEMLGAGVSQADIAAGREFQEVQRRAGKPVQPLEVVIGLTKPRPRIGHKDSLAQKVVDFSREALLRRGTYEQIALLADQKALQEIDPERREQARDLSERAKKLSGSHQIEFNWYGGNVSLAHQYQDAVTERLTAAASTLGKRNEALAVLWTITRHLEWQGFACTKTAADLCEITGSPPANMARALALLEQVGAIHRVKRGRTKVIAVTPEGAYRGKVSEHPATVERFRLEVIEGGKAKTSVSNADEPPLPFGE